MRTRHRFEIGMTVLVVTAALTTAVQSQPRIGEGPLPAFEYASVLSSHPAVGPMVSVSPETGRFSAKGVSLLDLVSYAYDTQPSKIVGGPDWIRSARYQIDARPSAEFVDRGDHLVIGQMRQLVKGLLFDYFGLVAHEDRSEVTVQGTDVARTVLADVVVIDQVNDQPADEPGGGFFEPVPRGQ